MNNNSLAPIPGRQVSQLGNQTASISNILSQPVKENPYTALIRRDTPTAFVFMIDQSGSMSYSIEFNGKTMTKAQAVAQAVNTTLTELMNRCTKGNELYHYFDIALVGYGRTEDDEAYSLFQGELKGKDWATPEEMYNNPLSEETFQDVKNVRGKIIPYDRTIKCWIEPKAHWNTPMLAAFEKVILLTREWIDKHQGKDCYPPTIINITDGEASDATDDELIEIAKSIKSLSTIDGNVLLLNSHLSETAGSIAVFPHSRNELPNDRCAKLLFDMASDMPNNDKFKLDIVNLKKEKGLPGEPPFKGMCFNADMSVLVRMLNVGTDTK